MVLQSHFWIFLQSSLMSIIYFIPSLVELKREKKKGKNSVFKKFKILKIIILQVMGFRTHHPKTWQFVILNILSWKNLGNSRYKKESLTSPFTPAVGHRPSCASYPPYTQRKDKEMPREIRTKRHCCLPQFITLSSYPFVLCFFMTEHFSSNLVKKSISLVLHVFIKALCHLILLLNRFVCLSSVNMSFDSLIYRALTRRLRRVFENNNVFLPTNILKVFLILKHNKIFYIILL